MGEGSAHGWHLKEDEGLQISPQSTDRHQYCFPDLVEVAVRPKQEECAEENCPPSSLIGMDPGKKN